MANKIMTALEGLSTPAVEDKILITDTSVITDNAAGSSRVITLDSLTGGGLPVGESATQTLTNKTLTSPTLTSPTLGVATATSINKVTITAPATSATLTLIDGVTVTGPGATGTLATLAGTETLSGKTLTAPVLGVATGTSLALGGGTALATTNRTGTGNLVLATTPTLTTPQISGDVDLDDTTGNITVAGADPVRGMYIPASGLTAATTNGAAIGTIETTTNKVIASVKDFDTTTQEFVGLAIQSPLWWNASTITAQFIWTAASGSGTVVWACQGIAFSNDDALDTAYGTEQTATDTLITAGDDHHSPVTSAITIAGTPTAGDLVCFRFKRNPADDTLGVDARLIAVKINWTMGQYSDA